MAKKWVKCIGCGQPIPKKSIGPRMCKACSRKDMFEVKPKKKK